MGIELQWGLNPIPENAMAAWGARAILKQQCLDLLWDRQCFVQGELSDQEKVRFVNWINKSGLPKLRKHIVKNRWKNDSEEVFELNDKKFPPACQLSWLLRLLLHFSLARATRTELTLVRYQKNKSLF